MTGVVHFTYRTASFDLVLDGLGNLPIRNIRKIFKLMLSEADDNAEAIEETASFLPDKVADCKKAWEEASINYQRGWRMVKNKKSRNPATLEILKENNILTRALQHAKKQYELWQKIQGIWDDTKHQMNLQ